jgi:hypothetical protein
VAHNTHDLKIFEGGREKNGGGRPFPECFRLDFDCLPSPLNLSDNSQVRTGKYSRVYYCHLPERITVADSWADKLP